MLISLTVRAKDYKNLSANQTMGFDPQFIVGLKANPNASINGNSEFKYVDPNGPEVFYCVNETVAAIITASGSGSNLYQGAIDCSTNPLYPAGEKDWYWLVSVAGRIGGGAGKLVEVGDVIYCTQTNVGGTEAAVGTFFYVVQKNMIPCTAAVFQAGTNNTDFVTAATMTAVGFTATATLTTVANTSIYLNANTIRLSDAAGTGGAVVTGVESQNIRIETLDCTTVDASSGSLNLGTGDADGTGTSGSSAIFTGAAGLTGNSGWVTIDTGAAFTGGSGSVGINTGAVATLGNSGNVSISTGDSTTVGDSGYVGITTGAAVTGDSGNININTGAVTTSGATGDITMFTGAGIDSGSGDISIYTGDVATDVSSGSIYISTGDGGTAIGTAGVGAIIFTTGNAATDSQMDAGGVQYNLGSGADDTLGAVTGSGGLFRIAGGTGGDTIVGVGGTGSTVIVNTGEGGSTTGAGIGGRGGYFGVVGGDGGEATAGGTGGLGGYVSLVGGTGGDSLTGTTGVGGYVYLAGGNAGDTASTAVGADGGYVSIVAGRGTAVARDVAAGDGGNVSITSGLGGGALAGGGANTAGAGGTVSITAADGGVGSSGGAAASGGAGGHIELLAGNGGDADGGGVSGIGGHITITAGSSPMPTAGTGSDGGYIYITAGDSNTDGDGGDIHITAGTGASNTYGGEIKIDAGATGAPITDALNGDVRIGSNGTTRKLLVTPQATMHSAVWYDKFYWNEDFDDEAATVQFESGLMADFWTTAGTNYAPANVTYLGGIGGTLKAMCANADNDSVTILGLPNFNVAQNPIFEARIKIDTKETAAFYVGVTTAAFADVNGAGPNDSYLIGINSDDGHGYGATQIVGYSTAGGAGAVYDDMGIAIVSDQYITVRFDLTDPTEPRVWINATGGPITDANEIAGGAFTGAIGAAATVSPYIMVQNLAGGAIQRFVTVDYVRIWQDRV